MSEGGGDEIGRFSILYYENAIGEQMALPMQVCALNDGDMVSKLTLSPSSTPFPGPRVLLFFCFWCT